MSPESPSPRRKTRSPGGGRRRDPKLDDRILEAARDVYENEGWAGFTVDAVSKRALVSRDAVTRRYSDRQNLLHASVMVGIPDPPPAYQGGSLREIVTDYAVSMFDYFSVGRGTLLYRVHLEAHEFPEVYRDYREQVVEPARDTLQAALMQLFDEAGLDVSTLDTSAVYETLAGAILWHALLNQASEQDEQRHPDLARRAIRNQIDMLFAAIGVPADQ